MRKRFVRASLLVAGVLIVGLQPGTALARTPDGDSGGGGGTTPPTTTTPGEATFGCTGAPVDWVVPAGVASVDVVAVGASGSSSASGSAGGLGARVNGTVPVTAGETLHLRVGCTGGYNGGGTTGSSGGYGNGGGATDVRQGGDALGNRVVTAAGGGGGGNGGVGGTAAGAAGGDGVGGQGDGLGATTSAGGYRGGSLGLGGSGEGLVGGGAGGGGVFGGGGSGMYEWCDLCTEPLTLPGGGGGAGSSAGPAGSTITAAAAAGNGSLQLSWIATTPVAIPTTITLSISVQPAEANVPFSVEATVSGASGPVTSGPIKFVFADGEVSTSVSSDGTAEVRRDIADTGTFPVHIEYLGDDGYLPSSLDTTLTVVDTMSPDLTVSLPPAPASGWFTEPVAGTVVASDLVAIAALDCVGATVSDVQGLGGSPASATLTVTAEGSNDVVCTATDPSGNVGTSAPMTLQVDTIDPTLTWSGAISDGGSYPFGSVPGAPTCTAADDGSGAAGCVVAGYDETSGTHTLTATATDVAGNSTVETRTYTVQSWDVRGFYAPIDMGDVVNTVKAGSTVPLKFEVFIGGVEQTSTSVVRSLRAVSTMCSSGIAQDEIEATGSGATELRYDTAAGAFVYDWKTPRSPGSCVDIIVQTLDGSSIAAHVRLR